MYVCICVCACVCMYITIYSIPHTWNCYLITTLFDAKHHGLATLFTLFQPCYMVVQPQAFNVFMYMASRFERVVISIFGHSNLSVPLLKHLLKHFI